MEYTVSLADQNKHFKVSIGTKEKAPEPSQVDWNNIVQCQTLSESFIHQYQDLVDWKLISQCQILSESFISDHQDLVNWPTISEYQLFIGWRKRDDCAMSV